MPVDEVETTEAPVDAGQASVNDAIEESLNEQLPDSETESDNSAAEKPSVKSRSNPNQKAAAPETAETTESEQNWDKLPSWAKKSYEDTRKSYDHMRSLHDRKSTEWKTEAEKIKDYQAKVDQLAYFSKLYDSNPEVRSVLDKALGVKNQVDPTLAEDPLYKYIETHNQKTQAQLQPLIQWMQGQQQAEQTRQLNAQVDQATDQAKARFKTLLGKDPTDDDVSKIYQYMIDHRVYHGEAAVNSLFMQEAISQAKQQAMQSQMAKKSTSSKLSTVNSAKAKPNGRINSIEDAFDAAIEELGITI